ncbi:MAG: hypothetical protein LBT62_02165 [Deltaproteobacteria bacterium]|jgi:hypothetical protein|nr:hypothetical protein [Deltaproteobacteria bacterium]
MKAGRFVKAIFFLKPDWFTRLALRFDGITDVFLRNSAIFDGLTIAKRHNQKNKKIVLNLKKMQNKLGA